MKKKNKSNKLMLTGLVLILLLLFIAFIFHKEYERIDIISDSDWNMQLRNAFSNEVKEADAYSTEINNFPENITISCNALESFEFEIRNKGKFAEKIIFSTENQEKLSIYFPEELIVPPKSEKNITIFLDIGCSEKGKTIKPTFRIKETTIQFNPDINIR